MNDWLGLLIGIVAFGIISLAIMNFWLLRVIHQLEQEVDSLQPPF